MTTAGARLLPDVVGSADVKETHAALILLIGDRAYKIKKPVSLGFLDFSSRESRAAACAREVALNRRFAPDVYLGVATIDGPDGSPCEHMVIMRRMPEDRRLSTMLHDGRAGEHDVHDVVRAIAGFHGSAPSSPRITQAGAPQAIDRNWRENLDEIARFEATMLPSGSVTEIRRLADRYVSGRHQLFEERIEQGWIRDGHGDLLSDDIFLLDDGPRILDCIEFDDRFRHGDVLADITFLAMDLEARGLEHLATAAMRWHAELLGDHPPASLTDHYIAYRALVRAKVACVRAEQGQTEARERAVSLLQMTRDHLERARVRLVLVGGTPGTGKSTFAAALGDALGWPVLRSDLIRKELTGTIGSARAAFGYGLYDHDTTTRTYEEMLARAGRLLARGESVILDATWSDDRRRQRAGDVATAHVSDLIELRCTTSSERVRARLEARADGASDADVAISDRIAASFDPWPTAASVDTSGPPGAALVEALPVVRRPPMAHAPVGP